MHATIRADPGRQACQTAAPVRQFGETTLDLVAIQQQLIGERRVCFLYSNAAPQRQSPLANSTCTDLVTVRVMAVTSNSDGSCDVTIQPSVLTTRTVVLASENATTTGQSGSNSNG